MSAVRNLSRREFIEGVGATSGLVLGCALIPDPVGTGTGRADGVSGGAPLRPNVFVSVASDGAVTVVCHRSEMGQQVHTSMAQIVADELDADWSRVVVVQAEGDAKYGDQNTDGSRSVRRNFTRLRLAGATARTMLRRAAAAQWEVPVFECQTADHGVKHLPSDRWLGYGELAAPAAALAVPRPTFVKLKEPKDWRLIGKPVPGVDAPAIVRGQGIFGIDVQLGGMKVAVIARPPVLFGRPKSVDAKAALAVPGVEAVVELPVLAPPAAFKALGGVAVVAANTWAALRGREALRIEWEPGSNAAYDSRSYRDALLATSRRPGRVVRSEGDAAAALAAADRVLSAEYYVPHLAQAPMEPPMATARVADGRAEIWASTQTPQATRREVASALGIDESSVRVHVTLLGGAFGRKSKPDFSVEAALVAREVRAPVKVMWTREDDLRNGYLHAVSAQHLEAALDDEGRTTAWLHRTVFPPIRSTFESGAMAGDTGELSQGFVDNPFAIPNMQLENGDAAGHARIGWMRSVANVYHAFAVQSFASELAVAAGRDPRDYLLELIGPPRKLDLAAMGVEYGNYGDPVDVYPIDTGRLANVARLAAGMAGWGEKLPMGRGRGIAVHRSFLTYVATVVEVEVSAEGKLAIPSVWVAIDAGIVVNPDHVRAQCEGGSVFGLSCALAGEITFTRGAVDQQNFDGFRVPRMKQSPKEIHVHIVESDAPPAGVGEPPTPPFAPALCNAIHAATGRRIRRLPIGDQLRA